MVFFLQHKIRYAVMINLTTAVLSKPSLVMLETVNRYHQYQGRRQKS